VVKLTGTQHPSPAAEQPWPLKCSPFSRHTPRPNVEHDGGRRWERQNRMWANEALHKKLGVVGLGKIGSHVARVAKAHGPWRCSLDPVSPPSAPTCWQVSSCWRSKPSVSPKADYISLQPARTPRYRAIWGWCVASSR